MVIGDFLVFNLFYISKRVNIEYLLNYFFILTSSIVIETYLSGEVS